MRIELVIFDCDGVLIDSEPIANRAHAEMLAQCGYPADAEDLAERFCGISDADMLAAIERDWGRALPGDYRERVERRLAEEYRRALAPMPGIEVALSQLSAPFCVASSGTPERIRLGLEAVGLLDRFQPNLFSAAMVARGKPAPDLFLLAARQMGAKPEACVVIEDSPAGIVAARAAGMAALGFCGGSHCRSGHETRLLAEGAVRAIATMTALPGAIIDLALRK